MGGLVCAAYRSTVVFPHSSLRLGMTYVVEFFVVVVFSLLTASSPLPNLLIHLHMMQTRHVSFTIIYLLSVVLLHVMPHRPIVISGLLPLHAGV